VPAADLKQPPALVGPQTLVSGSLVFGPTGPDGAASPGSSGPGRRRRWFRRRRRRANGTATPGDLVDAAGVASLTGYASPSATSSITSNGSAIGTIDSIAIDASGQILATFGAGKTVTVGQLAMANFNNPQGLVKHGSNSYGESARPASPTSASRAPADAAP
jgi:flagellar hook protein FlgE